MKENEHWALSLRTGMSIENTRNKTEKEIAWSTGLVSNGESAIRGDL